MTGEREPTGGDSGKTRRYREKYDRILDAAAALINSVGARGMTFADVARLVDLNTTSVTYYFKRKEQLALACYHRAIDRYGDFVAQAEGEADVEARIAAFIAAAFDDLRAIREGRAAPHAVLSEVRTLDDPAKRVALDRYGMLFARLRAMLGDEGKGAGAIARARMTARTNVLLENLFWLPFWIDRYDLSDFPRVQARMTDLMLRGMAAEAQPWSPGAPAPEPAPQDSGGRVAQDDFLRAATLLINERGYRGASVERIASHLNVTKGSFYHHLDAKDDLVLACFSRSFDIVARSQHAAGSGEGNHWARVGASIAQLLHRQFGEDGTLLRSTALQALPENVRATVVDQSNRLARRYAGMLSDGIADGSVRPVDPLIAAQMIMATVNSAYDMRWWAARLPTDDAVRFYGSALAHGLMHDG